MHLFFDVETTGLPKHWGAPVQQVENWPRVVQLGWLRYDNDGKLASEHSRIIRPEGFRIPEKVAAIHGITTERALKEGEPLDDVLSDFTSDLDQAGLLIAHNLDFDRNILGAELYRQKLHERFLRMPGICTMKDAKDHCRIPGRAGYKWPKLEELHRYLFDESFDGAHDALIDTRACARCFFELHKRGAFTKVRTFY